MHMVGRPVLCISLFYYNYYVNEETYAILIDNYPLTIAGFILILYVSCKEYSIDGTVVVGVVGEVGMCHNRI